MTGCSVVVVVDGSSVVVAEVSAVVVGIVVGTMVVLGGAVVFDPAATFKAVTGRSAEPPQAAASRDRATTATKALTRALLSVDISCSLANLEKPTLAGQGNPA